jgi:hypothetical protein
MCHSLSYRDWLKSSNAQVAFVGANFTAGRGHAWEGGRAPRSGIEATRATSLSTTRLARSLGEGRRDRGQCVLCASTKNLHFDHDIPFSKGGSSLTAANVRLLCAKCNPQKSDKISWLAVASAEAADDCSVDFRWNCGGAAHRINFPTNIALIVIFDLRDIFDVCSRSPTQNSFS